MDCIALALHIGASQELVDFAEGKTSAQYTPDDCRTLLVNWWRTQAKGAGAVLYHGLVKIGRKDVAEKYTKELLGSKITAAEIETELKEIRTNQASKD